MQALAPFQIECEADTPEGFKSITFTPTGVIGFDPGYGEAKEGVLWKVSGLPPKAQDTIERGNMMIQEAFALMVEVMEDLSRCGYVVDEDIEFGSYPLYLPEA